MQRKCELNHREVRQFETFPQGEWTCTHFPEGKPPLWNSSILCQQFGAGPSCSLAMDMEKDRIQAQAHAAKPDLSLPCCTSLPAQEHSYPTYFVPDGGTPPLLSHLSMVTWSLHMATSNCTALCCLAMPCLTLATLCDFWQNPGTSSWFLPALPEQCTFCWQRIRLLVSCIFCCYSKELRFIIHDSQPLNPE